MTSNLEVKLAKFYLMTDEIQELEGKEGEEDKIEELKVCCKTLVEDIRRIDPEVCNYLVDVNISSRPKK